MEPMHLHGSMDVPPNITPIYEMTKKKHMAALLDQINCQLTDAEYANLSPYWTLDTALYLHRVQHDREVATAAFLEQYWETVRQSYAELGVLCTPPFSIPLDIQQLEESVRWRAGDVSLRRQTFPPVLVTFDGVGFHEYLLSRAEVNGEPYTYQGIRHQGRNTLVFALADDQFLPSHAQPAAPSVAPQSAPRSRRRSSHRRSSIHSNRVSITRAVPPIPLPSTPPQPDMPMPPAQSAPKPRTDVLSAALAAAKTLLQYPESEPFRPELKTFIDLLIETRSSEARMKTALSNPKFLKRLSKFMRWYEDLEGERTLGKRLLFKLEDQPRLRDFFTKLTHVRAADAPERRRAGIMSQQALELDRVEQALDAFHDLVDRMADLSNEPSVDA